MQNTSTQNVTGKVMMELSDKEAKVIEHLRAFAFGKIIVHQENNQPVRIEEIEEKIRTKIKELENE